MRGAAARALGAVSAFLGGPSAASGARDLAQALTTFLKPTLPWEVLWQSSHCSLDRHAIRDMKTSERWVLCSEHPFLTSWIRGGARLDESRGGRQPCVPHAHIAMRGASCPQTRHGGLLGLRALFMSCDSAVRAALLPALVPAIVERSAFARPNRAEGRPHERDPPTQK